MADSKPGRGPDATDEELLSALERATDPVDSPVASAGDVAEHVPINADSVRKRLTTMVETGPVETRKFGRSRLFWPTADEREHQARLDELDQEPEQRDEPSPQPEPEPVPEPAHDPLSGVEFPESRDRDDCLRVVRAAESYLREHETATMRDFVREVLPEHSLGYEIVELEPGDRYRGAWWRRVVKPGLEALETVEKPTSGGSEWRYVDE